MRIRARKLVCVLKDAVGMVIYGLELGVTGWRIGVCVVVVWDCMWWGEGLRGVVGVLVDG